MESIHDDIINFKAEMVKLGYIEGEANALFHDFIGDKNLNALTKNELDNLAEEMSNYVSFARKCKQVI